MAQFTGFYSGLKEGRETLANTNLQAMQRRRMEQQTNFEAQQMADKERAKALLSQAYSANAPTRMNDSYEEFIKQSATQTENAAKSIMGIDPETGLALLKQSQAERKSAYDVAGNNLELKKRQLDVAGSISSQVIDQASLDEAVVELARVGTVVPDRYKTWSPETKEWLGRRALASTNYLKTLELDQTAQKVQIQAEEAQSKQQDRLAKQAATVRKEQLAREKIEIGRKQYKPSKDEAKMVRSELKLLSDIDENFDSLPSTEQDAAAKDVRYLKSTYMAEDPKLTEDLALQRARRAVVGRITEGKYPVMGSADMAQGTQVKVFNGIEYVKVPGGWKRKQ